MEFLLKRKQLPVTSYDPFFNPISLPNEPAFDYIIACEVVEHFYDPKKEFETLYQLLHTGGTLICKTKLHDTQSDFANWWYKNDPTHVFFYSKQTFEVIKTQYEFKRLEILEDYLTLQK